MTYPVGWLGSLAAAAALSSCTASLSATREHFMTVLLNLQTLWRILLAHGSCIAMFWLRPDMDEVVLIKEPRRILYMN
jgi:hypothetical protein